ncbi:hypothetical protein GEMRC1_007182 [Eukaryota sp. GEM-RC1]
MFDCFANTTIQMSGSAGFVQDSTTNDILISTGELVGLKHFITYIEFTSQIILYISIPITSLQAYNTSLVCFVNHPCEIEVYSIYNEVALTDFQVSSSIPNSLQILNFETSPSSAYIMFISTLSGVVDDLELCTEAGCYPISNLPFIVLPISISPQFIQWFGSSFGHEISLEAEGIHFYQHSAIETSIMFGGLVS